jgi:hypothetical protein
MASDVERERVGAAAVRLSTGLAPLAVLSAAWCSVGCSPALDWREVRLPGMAVVATLPCKPNVSTRSVQLADQVVRLSMLSCKADDVTWALAAADVVDPARVGPALQALRESTRANLQGQVAEAGPATVRGATPHEGQSRVRVSGRKQDGSAISAQLIVFSHGTQVFQAIVMGARQPESAAETFFDSLRAGPSQ